MYKCPCCNGFGIKNQEECPECEGEGGFYSNSNQSDAEPDSYDGGRLSDADGNL